MSALVTLPALTVDAIVCYLTFLDHRDLLFLCKSMRDSAWHEVILSNQRLAFPPELQDARACMAAMQPLIRSYFTAFRLADTDVLGDLIQAFPRVRRLKISTQEVKWGTSSRNERAVTLDTQRLSPLTQSLVYLDLSRSGVSDLRPLAQLVQLEELNLSHNDSLRSLDPLKALVRVRVLDVSHTNASRITCVSVMYALVSLDISDTLVDTLAPLSDLQHLHTVKIRQNRTNTIALEDLCDSLRVLELGSTMNTLTFNHLQKLQKLEVCTRVDQPMIQVISTLVNLQELEIGQITYGVTISSLGSLIQLRVLRVMVNSVAEVALLRSLRHLKELLIRAQEYRSQTRDFEFFGNFPALEKLEYVCMDALSTNSDSIPCTGLRSLILNCDQARFGLNQAPAQIPMVIPENLLRRNPDLRLLKIQENYRDILQNLEELAAVPHLLELHLELSLLRYKRPRKFWRPLEALVNLRRLTLVNARMPNFTSFLTMTKLEVIALKHGQLSSFSGIEALVSLEVLDLGTSILPDITPLRCLTLLRRLTLPKSVDCSPVANGELPRLVELFHPRQNCLGMTPAPTRYSLRHPRKRCRE